MGLYRVITLHSFRRSITGLPSEARPVAGDTDVRFQF